MVAVEGLVVRRVKNGRGSLDHIDTVAGVIMLGHDAILEDIHTAIKNHSKLEEGLLGKSNSPSGSLPAEIGESGSGVALDADVRMLETSMARSFESPEDAIEAARKSSSNGRPVSTVARGAS